MGEQDARDSSEDLAAWLKDAGRRTWKTDRPAGADRSAAPAEPPETLIKYLEHLAGRNIRSIDDLRHYIAEISGKNSGVPENGRARQLVRHTLLLLGLLIAYMQYNFLDVSLQIARLPATIIFVPVDTGNASYRSGDPVRAGSADQSGVTRSRA